MKPTDDVVDNSGGDEDDHDPAGVIVSIYDLALTKVYTSDNSADGISNDGVIVAGDDVTFNVTVFNQGTYDATDVVVTDYIPTGFVLNDPTWNDNGDGTARITVCVHPIGTSVSVPITLTAESSSTGLFQNWAEISVDDGDDADTHLPNTDPDDDGSFVDNETDNAGGDEDDHDPAPVDVVADLDLALVKTLDALNTELPVVLNQTVTFLLTVINQGSTTAEGIELIDYVNTSQWLGFDTSLNPNGITTGKCGSFIQLGNFGKQRFVVAIDGQLASGQSVTLPVTLTVAPGADLTSLLNTAEITAGAE